MGLDERERGEALYLEENAKRCVKKKERKTEQWEDKSSYIHRSSSSKFH
jgi:hypothetical protein